MLSLIGWMSWESREREREREKERERERDRERHTHRGGEGNRIISYMTYDL